jgi:hypothetical protein
MLFSLSFRGCAPVLKSVLILTFSHVISMDVAIFSVDLEMELGTLLVSSE